MADGKHGNALGERRFRRVLKRADDDKYPFSFGKSKAKLIVENFEAIKKFAEEE